MTQVVLDIKNPKVIPSIASFIQQYDGVKMRRAPLDDTHDPKIRKQAQSIRNSMRRALKELHEAEQGRDGFMPIESLFDD